ncbi:MAG: 5'/3'-nucleotidase SurE [Candidatus Methylomirabilales bacterium]
MPDRPLVLVTNDDGAHAPGLLALARAMEALGEVYVVAPDRERSAAGHSLTLHRPLRATEIRERFFMVDGTPTDCVALAVMGILKERPRLLASGINQGANMGDDVTYSGTVSAAFEGMLLGIPSMAVSLVDAPGADREVAARVATRLGRLILNRGIPLDTLLNVNVPAGRARGFSVTRQGKRTYNEVIVEKVDPRGRAYYWIGGGAPAWEMGEGTDYQAVSAGRVSVTPLHLNLTNVQALEELRAWEGLSAEGE